MSLQTIPSEYIKPDFSTKLIKSIYNYFSKYYSEEMIKNILAELGMAEDYFLNDDNWHSNELNKLICNRIIQETGDPDILFNIGKELLQPQNINFLEYQLLKILPPFFIFKNLPTQASKINNVFKLDIIKSQPGQFTYRVNLEKGLDVHTGVFQNTEGCIHAFKEFCSLRKFSLTSETIEQKDKIEIIYKLKYSATKYWLKIFTPITIYAGVGFFLTSFLSKRTIEYSSVTVGISLLSTITSLIIIGFLIKKLISISKNNHLYYTNTRGKNQKIYEKTVSLEKKLNNEQYTKNICLRLIKSKKAEDIIDDTLDLICENKQYEKAIVMLASEKNKTLKVSSIRGLQHNNDLANFEVQYPAASSDAQFFANILENKKPVLIDEIETFKEKLLDKNKKIIENISVNSLIVLPIGDSERSYGLLVIGSTNEKKKLNLDDLIFLDHISSLMSLFFQKCYTLETESTLRSIFEKYVPKTVLSEIDNIKDKNSWRIPPQTSHVASMFLDLKGFTTATENLAPESIFKMLDLYFEMIVKIIGANGGIIDNIIGDEIVAFFPNKPSNKHCTDCVLTALQICAEWKNIQLEAQNYSFPKLSAGIGIHCGKASIGTVGSDIRSNYTCLGDTINTTSRLQTLTRKFFSETTNSLILASQEIINLSGIPINYIELPNECVRGRNSTINLALINEKSATEFHSFVKNIKQVG